MTLHARGRCLERCPDVDFDDMARAMNDYFDEKDPPEITKVMSTEDGTFFRYVSARSGVKAYPVVPNDSRSIVTVYSQAQIKKKKLARKYRRKLNSGYQPLKVFT